jgi:hypothetical protein
MQKVLIILMLSILIIGCSNPSIGPEQAQKIATKEFRKFCIQFHLAIDDFSGPTIDREGQSHYSFTWSDIQPDGKFDIIVIVQKSGIVNVSPLNKYKGYKYNHVVPFLNR